MSEFTFKQQANVSLREKVTNDLREAILNGYIQPGQRIKEQEIAAQMGISRGPVREAIRHLEREGLLISYPYKETVVADLNVDEVQQILLPIRFHIESFVLKRYAGKVDEAFYSRLQSIIDRMQSAVDSGNPSVLVELDIEFHETIISLAVERTVFITWRSIVNQIRLHFSKNLRFQYDQIVSDHQKLLDALKTKDPDLIQAAMTQHLTSEDSLLCFMPERS
ncbi:GntR family transcriptional regulator [Paenibacillus thermotolerans]|uniref:GntR family transcriptional regulator n=1 Tax=Paenibacillus thermotolerans TaxID=3027807 RepID=UPI0023682216|nr:MULTISPECIES: GntR family transcriptional regulator [unclassified Paenibacillus]